MRSAALALVIGAFIAGSLYAVFPDLCENDVIARYPSPDGQLELVVFERDCGATTDFSTQASLLERGAKLHNQAGDVFIATTNHGSVPAGPGGGPEVRARWIGSRDLTIEYRKSAQVFKSSRSVRSVRVEYSTFQQ